MSSSPGMTTDIQEVMNSTQEGYREDVKKVIFKVY
jgi:hypothetical protein